MNIPQILLTPFVGGVYFYGNKIVVINQAKIIDVVQETAQCKSFVLEPLNDWQPAYEAGQFVTLVFNNNEQEKRRSYSISSSPAWDEPLTITVKAIPNGEFSRQLVQQYTTGDLLTISHISGLFRIPDIIEAYHQYTFFAAGSGITPCFSLIKTLLKLSKTRIVLVYSNQSPNDAIFYQQLQILQAAFSERFTIIYLFSNDGQRLSKPLLQQLLDRFAPTEKNKTLFYTCGPELYMEIIQIVLLTEGVPRQNIRKENFDSRPRIYKPLPPDTDPHWIELSTDTSTHKFIAAHPNSILDAAVAKTIPLPYSCLAGRCGSCIARCTQGKVWMAYNEVLTDKDIEKGFILTCQSYPIEGDVHIKL